MSNSSKKVLIAAATLMLAGLTALVFALVLVDQVRLIPLSRWEMPTWFVAIDCTAAGNKCFVNGSDQNFWIEIADNRLRVTAQYENTCRPQYWPEVHLNPSGDRALLECNDRTMVVDESAVPTIVIEHKYVDWIDDRRLLAIDGKALIVDSDTATGTEVNELNALLPQADADVALAGLDKGALIGVGRKLLIWHEADHSIEILENDSAISFVMAPDRVVISEGAKWFCESKTVRELTTGRVTAFNQAVDVIPAELFGQPALYALRCEPWYDLATLLMSENSRYENHFVDIVAADSRYGRVLLPSNHPVDLAVLPGGNQLIVAEYSALELCDIEMGNVLLEIMDSLRKLGRMAEEKYHDQP